MRSERIGLCKVEYGPRQIDIQGLRRLTSYGDLDKETSAQREEKDGLKILWGLRDARPASNVTPSLNG